MFPDVPDNAIDSLIGYVGLVLFLLSIILILGGIGVVNIERISVEKGRRSVAIGVLFIVLSSVLVSWDLGLFSPGESREDFPGAGTVIWAETASAEASEPSPTLTPIAGGKLTPGSAIPLQKSSLGNSAGRHGIDLAVIGFPEERSFVIVGSIDGTQSDTRDFVVELINFLEASPSEIPLGTAFHLIPSINPDGIARSSRYNSNGIDLNRNWDTSNWTSDPPVPGSPEGRAGVGGERPMSEPEVLALSSYLADLKKVTDDAYLVILHSSVQTTSGHVFPGYTATGLHRQSENAAREVAVQLGYSFSTEWEYDTPGEAINWAAENGIVSIDILWPNGLPPQVDRFAEVMGGIGG